MCALGSLCLTRPLTPMISFLAQDFNSSCGFQRSIILVLWRQCGEKAPHLTKYLSFIRSS